MCREELPSEILYTPRVVGLCVPEHGGVAEDLVVDLLQDARVGAQGRRDILIAEKEADRAFEEAFKGWALDELGETGVEGCREDEHVAELPGRY